MRPRFFPSRMLTIYMSRLFLTRTLGVMAGLLLILLTLDLLGESGNILAVPENGQATLLHYASLRAPAIVQTFLPFSVLLGTLIMLLQLNGASEVVAMKASGLSAHQILAPMVACGLVVAGLSYLFADRVAAPSAARLSAWQAVDYGPIVPTGGARTDVFVRAGDDILHAGTVLGSGPATELRDVTLFERQNGTLHHLTRAASGRFAPDGTLVLPDASAFDVERATLDSAGTLRLRGLTPDRFTLANVDPAQLSARELGAAIRELEASGRPTVQLKPGWWHKFSAPLSAALMPLLAAVAGFGLARSGQLFVRAIAGMALGFAYFVADNFALAMGNLGAYPPWLAAWGPLLLFVLIGETVLIRTEE